jgi:hypothetical protein
MHESKKNEMGAQSEHTDCRKKYRLPEKIPIADA